MNLEQAADELFAIATGPDYRFECLSLVSPDKTAIVRETPAHGQFRILLREYSADATMCGELDGKKADVSCRLTPDGVVMVYRGFGKEVSAE